MQTKAKEGSIVTSKIPEGTKMVKLVVMVPARMVFSVLDTGDVDFNLTKVSAENHGRALVHGWNQRIPDGAAIGRADADGNIIPKAERNRIKKERMNDLATHYESGTAEWSRKSDGAGSRSITIEAIARCKGIDYEAAEDLVDQHAEMHKMDRKAALADIRKKSVKVQTAMAEIRQERDARKLANVPTAEDLLDGIGEAPEADDAE